MSVLKKALLATIAVFCGICASGQEIQGIHALLDRVEKAYETHDPQLLAGQYSEEGFLILMQTPQGAVAFNRAEALTLIPQRWGRIAGHRFVGRDIQLMGDFALMRLQIADRFTDGGYQTTEFLCGAVQRDGVWKMCFGMESFLRPVVVVGGFAEGSAAQQAGVQAGDVITAYQGQAIETIEQLQKMTQSTGKADTVVLSVLRDGMPQRLTVSGGLLGIQCEQRLLPEGNAVLFKEEKEHPIQELMREELRGLMTGDVERASAMIHPTHFLAIKPLPDQACLLVPREAVSGIYQDALSSLRQSYDLATAKYLNMRVIEYGDLAVASNRYEVEKRDAPGEKISQPSVLEVFLRQQNRWHLVAMLPLRVELGMEIDSPVEISLSRQQTKDLQRGLKGQICGIGVEIFEHADGIEVRKIFEGGGAEKAGILPGEVIVSIGGKSAKGMTTAEAAGMIRGPEGTEVVLRVRSVLGTQRNVRVIRCLFEVSGVTHRILRDQIGYLKITGFNQLTSQKVREALNEFSDKKVSGIILDLRACGGGLTPEIVKTADFFLPKGSNLWVQKYHDGKLETIRSRGDAMSRLPMVVLIDRHTQSGELLAGAFKVNDRAILLGETSSGASTMRSLEKNPDGTSRKVEMGGYYLDQNTPISGSGIQPNIVIDLDTTPDNQVLRRAITILEK